MRSLTLRLLVMTATLSLSSCAHAHPHPPGLPSPPPKAPPGWVVVLMPGPSGGYWALVPARSAPPGHSQLPAEAYDLTPLPPAGTGADPGLDGAPDADLVALEREVLDAVNARRAKEDLPPLQPHPLLDVAARSHSEEMARLDYFSHESPTAGRKQASDRVRQAGAAGWARVAENLAMGTFSGPAAEAIADGWMESPGHRRNLLDDSMRFTGVGIALSGNQLYVTQVFTDGLGE